MKRREWDSKTKLEIVLQGVKGRPVAEICRDYEICQTQYYKWRDQFFENAGVAFETKKNSCAEERLKRENERLKSIVGELTLELKKTDFGVLR